MSIVYARFCRFRHQATKNSNGFLWILASSLNSITSTRRSPDSIFDINDLLWTINFWRHSTCVSADSSGCLKLEWGMTLLVGVPSKAVLGLWPASSVIPKWDITAPCVHL